AARQRFEQYLPQTTTYWEDSYPAALRQIEDPPAVLWFGGQPTVPVVPPRCLAVIGSRRMSPYGKQATQFFSRELVNRWGCTIVSGCAFGIDTTAHWAALRAGGQTWGVWAAGLEQVPARVSALFASQRSSAV